MRAFAVILTCAALLTCGCVYTIHPIATPDTAVYDPALVGAWHNPSSAESWEFTPAEGYPGYHFVYTDTEGRQGVLQCSLVEVDGVRVLDFYPDPDSADACGFEGMNDFYRMHFPPMHTFALVRQVEPALVLAFPDYQWIEDYLTANPDSIQHECEEVIFLTAGSAELCDFIAALAPMEGAFGDSDPLYRDGSMPAPTAEMMH
jgi:hypothetical protein